MRTEIKCLENLCRCWTALWYLQKFNYRVAATFDREALLYPEKGGEKHYRSFRKWLLGQEPSLRLEDFLPTPMSQNRNPLFDMIVANTPPVLYRWSRFRMVYQLETELPEDLEEIRWKYIRFPFDCCSMQLLNPIRRAGQDPGDHLLICQDQHKLTLILFPAVPGDYYSMPKTDKDRLRKLVKDKNWKALKEKTLLIHKDIDAHVDNKISFVQFHFPPNFDPEMTVADVLALAAGPEEEIRIAAEMVRHMVGLCLYLNRGFASSTGGAHNGGGDVEELLPEYSEGDIFTVSHVSSIRHGDFNCGGHGGDSEKDKTTRGPHWRRPHERRIRDKMGEIKMIINIDRSRIHPELPIPEGTLKRLK